MYIKILVKISVFLLIPTFNVKYIYYMFYVKIRMNVNGTQEIKNMTNIFQMKKVKEERKRIRREKNLMV